MKKFAHFVVLQVFEKLTLKIYTFYIKILHLDDVLVISNSYLITELTMREVISLHVGQAGVQMGNLR